SSSTRVLSLPSAMKRTSTSVLRFASCCQSGVISHESTIRECGSHERTRPQSHVLPSSPRSYQRPPTCGSITASTRFALPILWVASGHQVPIFSVKTRQATSGGALTITTLRRLFAWSLSRTVCSFMKTFFRVSWFLVQPLPCRRRAFHPRIRRASCEALRGPARPPHRAGVYPRRDPPPVVPP